MALTLYYHPLSSYCHKVLIALYGRQVAFEARLVDLGDPTERAVLEAQWPLCKFPVLHDADTGISYPESTIIIEYLDRHRPGPPLIPPDPEAALEVRLWDRIFDNYVHTPMQQIVADRIFGQNGDVSRHRTLIRDAYRLIDAEVTGRHWAMGADFTLADCAAAPALFYASTLEPFPADARGLHEYFERLVAHPPVRRTLDEAKPYFRFYPFVEAMPARFLP